MRPPLHLTASPRMLAPVYHPPTRSSRELASERTAQLSPRQPRNNALPLSFLPPHDKGTAPKSRSLHAGRHKGVGGQRWGCARSGPIAPRAIIHHPLNSRAPGGCSLSLSLRSPILPTLLLPKKLSPRALSSRHFSGLLKRVQAAAANPLALPSLVFICFRNYRPCPKRGAKRARRRAEAAFEGLLN